MSARIDDRIGDHATQPGQRVRDICRAIWPSEINPAKRRPGLRSAKKATTLMDYTARVANAVGEDADDLLLDAFRGSRFDEAVSARMAGRDGGPDIEDCWTVVSETLQRLAQEVARVERLDVHQRRLLSVTGTYDLAQDVICAGSGPFLYGPLANWSVFNGEYPPIPSVILLREPKSASVQCHLIVDSSSEARSVQVTVMREVRLAIGPADDVAKPRALFEFRSVLDLTGPDGPVRVLRPWHDLEDRAVIVEVGGAWCPSKLDFPTAPVTDGHFVELFGSGSPARRFPAALETPLQFEHHDIVWRPVTASTCRDLLQRAEDEFSVPWPPIHQSPDNTAAACPPRSLGHGLEMALLDQGPDGLAARLRIEARRMVEMVRGWHAERIDLAEDTHQRLRTTWEAWS